MTKRIQLIIVEDVRHRGENYFRVKSMTNTVKWKVGQRLSKREVKSIIANHKETEVKVVESHL